MDINLKPDGSHLNEEQTKYLEGFFTALGRIPNLDQPENNFKYEQASASNSSPFGIPKEELSQEEIWKLDENSLQYYDKIQFHADQEKFPSSSRYFSI